MHNSMVYGALSIELRKLSDDEIIKRLARCDKPSENPMFTDDATHIRFFLERERKLSPEFIDTELAKLKAR